MTSYGPQKIYENPLKICIKGKLIIPESKEEIKQEI
jgi:hypothetical protein